MNVLLIVPEPDVHCEAICSWKSRLTHHDELFILSLARSDVRQICGCDVHVLEVDTTKQGKRPVWFRVFGRWPSLLRWLWTMALRQIWPDFLLTSWPSEAELIRWSDFLWNVRSFDPDVIDLRWVPGSWVLKSKLETQSKAVVLTDGNKAPSEAITGSWRSYDPGIKVSIVLPVYNGAQYLRQSIESCLEQTHKNLELVVVDDGSTDETPLIVAEYVKHDSRIIPIRNERNLGLPGALNVGFTHTTGKLLTWTSHDNYYVPQAIETLVRYLCTWRDVDLVYSAYRIINAEGDVAPNVNYLPPPWELPYHNTVGAYFLYRRAVYDQVGEYRENIECAEDYDYWVRVYKAGFKMMRLHVPLYYYRHHPRSLTSKQASRVIELTRRVRQEHFGSTQR